ncbi:hypothetical protein KPL71_001103 [Citrus sinensis]|uniref:Uncharacterized protein n=1 Tax=Citrus sinensis TaxID=2711 RepID=A0ACB8NU16_CITSI|nr:hypothetical protein KPL71_001103 [Citrus sinensis]
METGIFVNQSKYAKSLVKRFGLDSTKHMKTLMGTNTKLTIDDSGSNVAPSLYRSMIGSLLYLTASRLNICFSVGVCARCQANPKESHLAAVKRIIRFVSGTINDGIWYTNDTNSSFARYSDADWAGNADDTEAEYIAAGSCCTQLLWMKQMLVDYGMVQDTLTVFCDNTSAINISKNPVQHSRTKHIDIHHQFIRDLEESKTVSLEYIDIEKQLADIFTKALDSKRFESLRKALDVCSILKFGQIPPKESMHSSDNDSMESDPTEDSFNSGPSTFDPKITTTAVFTHVAVIDHQLPPHAPSPVELLPCLEDRGPRGVAIIQEKQIQFKVE